ncbi:MAG TPA: metal ABC transporter permease, partial [Candidatus Paceibacterota bacterium]|nr:metal ABC transporter permease [Candidatus Paceibacterota bacterium]
VAPWWGALPALILVSTLVWWLRWYHPQYSPEAVAMFFLSGGLALALALVHTARDQTFAFENYLFGSILTLTVPELLTMTGATVVVAGVVWWLWYPLVGALQQPPYQLPYRRTPQLVQLVFFWLLAVAVWIGIKTIGGLLIGALLVIPVLTVRAWVASFRGVVIASMGATLSAVIGGLLVSLVFDVPPSSLIIGVLIIQFILQLLLTRVRTQA